MASIQNEFSTTKGLRFNNTNNPGASCFFVVFMDRLPEPAETNHQLLSAISEYGNLSKFADQSILNIAFRTNYSVMAPCLPVKVMGADTNSSSRWSSKHCKEKTPMYSHGYLKKCLK